MNNVSSKLEIRSLIQALKWKYEWSLWELFLLALAWWAPFGGKVIMNREGTEPYLLRIYLLPKATFTHRGLYLHLFLLSDEDAECHNHPFETSYSLILSRGYVEQVLTSASREDDHAPYITEHVRKPGRLVVIGRHHFHRVRLVRGFCWTLFSPGRRVGVGPEEWGFSNGWSFTPWRAYIEAQRGARKCLELIQGKRK